jgi:hypothetical protein
VVSEIGAVAFEKKAGGAVFSATGFETAVSISNQQGRRFDGATLLWLLAQEAAVKRTLELQRRAPPLEEARRALGRWFLDGCGLSKKEFELAGVWAKPSEFDLPILSDLHGGAQARPWSRKLSRDMRTFLEEHTPLAEQRWGEEHRAFHDACHQARHMIRVLNAEAGVRDGDTEPEGFFHRERKFISEQPLQHRFGAASLIRSLTASSKFPPTALCVHATRVCLHCRPDPRSTAPVTERCEHGHSHCPSCMEDSRIIRDHLEAERVRQGEGS